MSDRFGVGARTCIFRVGGQIDFVYCARCYSMPPFITIAGQTAPGNGIMLRNFELGVYGDVAPASHDVIVRHVRIRNHNYNDTNRCNNELFSVVFGGYNAIGDHISGGWNFRSAYSMAYDADRAVTVQWSLLSEGMGAAVGCASPPGAEQSLGGLSVNGGDKTNGISYLHNYVAHYGDRIPANLVSVTAQLINNVSYNTVGSGWVMTTSTAGSTQEPLVEYINNWYQPGANSTDTTSPRIILGAGLTNQPPSDARAAASQVYLSGNIHTIMRTSLTQPEAALAQQYDWGDPSHAVFLNLTTTRYASMPLIPSTVSAAQAKADVLANKVGAYGLLPQQLDAIDLRAIRALRNGSSGTTSAASTATSCSDGECGETGSYPAGTAYVDTDGDGIADSWETSHGLNPNNAADGPLIAANGYSNLENYINELAGDTTGLSTAPMITSALTGTATQGTAFSYQITATNTPTSYAASGLPAGLTVSTSTGLISGTPTGIGTFPVNLSATNATGTGTATLALTVRLVPQLYVHWQFNEGANFTVGDTGTCHCDGSVLGSPTWSPGREGTASLTFAGTAQYITNTSMVWPAGQPVTVVLWVNTAGGTPGGAFNVGGAGTPRLGAHIPWSDNVLYWDYGADAAERISVNYAPYLNAWTHVALVSNGTDFRGIYLNGTLATSNAVVGTAAGAMTGFEVGRYRADPGAAAYQTGSLDDVRLYTAALTAPEIQALYAQTAGRISHRAMMP